MPVTDCQDGYLRYTNPSYDFYSVIAPTDPRLPNGGGYRVLGLNTEVMNQPVGAPQAQTINPELNYYWHGVDTNFVWRGPRGVRVQLRHQHVPDEPRHLLLDPGRARTCAAAKDNEYEAGCRTRTRGRPG